MGPLIRVKEGHPVQRGKVKGLLNKDSKEPLVQLDKNRVYPNLDHSKVHPT